MLPLQNCKRSGVPPLALLLMSLGAVASVWWWLAIPINLARAPIDPNAKLQCI
jgi:glucan 1,3-beta-glucosidase